MCIKMSAEKRCALCASLGRTVKTCNEGKRTKKRAGDDASSPAPKRVQVPSGFLGTTVLSWTDRL